MDQDGKHQEIDKARQLIKRLHDKNLGWCRQPQSQDALGIIRDNIFGEQTHFILELIQNADDCESGEILFDLFENRLVVRNTGDSFSEKNVNALSNIGKSTKGEDHIGFFGIGFKSVFRVSDAPEVHSGLYHFRYDNHNLIVPRWIETQESTPSRGATFVLPFKDKEQNVKDIKKQLANFDGSVLLFLKHLKKIHINSSTYVINAVESSKNEFDLVKNGKRSSAWKKYSDVLTIPQSKQKTLQEDRGRRWSKKKREEIAISFQLDEKGFPLQDKKGRLYAFFPTEITTGLSFNIQADFLVPLTRTTLKNASGDWNQWIFSNTFRPVAKLINDFKTSSNLRTVFYRLLPRRDELTHDYLEPVKEGIDSYILEHPTVYTASERWVKPSQALIPDNGIEMLIEQKHLKKFFSGDKHYVSKEIDEKSLDYLKEHVEQFTYDDLFKKVLTNTEWLRTRPQKWFIKLYGHLWDWATSQGDFHSWERRQAFDRIKDARIFFSESKKLMAVEGKKRHLYRLEQQQAAFASLFRNEYELFNQKLYARLFSDATKNPDEKEAREKTRQLITELIPTLSVEKIMEDLIKPAFQDWENQTDARLLRYTDFVRRFGEKIKPDIIFLRQEGSEKSYMPPNRMFMPPEYGADATMRKLFGEKGVPFVSRFYIQKLLERTSERSRDDIASWRKFIQKLGGNERPIVVNPLKERSYSEIEQELQRYSPESKVEASNSGYKKMDHNFMAAFAEIIDSLQDDGTSDRIEKAKLVLKIIDDNWDHYKEYIDSYYVYHVKGAHESSHSRLSPSSLAMTIKEKAWVPTLKGKISKPRHVFLNLQTIKEAMGNQVEYVDGAIENCSLIKFAEFNDKPSVRAALNHLRGLTERGVKDYDSFRSSYLFFREFLGDPNSSARDKDMVIRAFKSEPLIFVPNHKTKPYRNYKEVVWSGPSFMNEFKPDLEKYFGLDSFFMDRIGVAQQLTTTDYVDFLIYLSNKEKLNSSDQEGMVSARIKVDDALADEAKEIANGKQRTEKQDKMMLHLRKDGKVWCDDKTWASFSDDLYYNDSPHIYALFKDILKIVYIDPRKGSKLPTHFFREFSIRGLKESAKEVAPDIEEEVVREGSQEETEKLHSLIPYLCGFIEQKDPEISQDLRQKGRFPKLASMKIRMVGELRTHYQINGIRQPNPDEKRAFYDELSNSLYLACDLHDCADDIGMTLSETLDDVPGIIDFIPRLVNLDEIERQNVIRRRGIEYVDFIDDGGVREAGSHDEKKEAEDKDQKPEAKEAPRRRAAPIPVKKTFDSKKYLEEIDPLLESVTVRHIDEKDLLEITLSGKVGSSGGGGGLWSGLTDEERKQIGDAAEGVALRMEKDKLKKLFERGKISQDLSEKIDHAAKRDDSAGYDIQSWNDDGEEIFIEVKGTPNPDSMEFPISREEFKKAEEKGDRYFIHRVLNVKNGKEPSVVVLKNPFRLWRRNKLRLITKTLLMTAEVKI